MDARETKKPAEPDWVLRMAWAMVAVGLVAVAVLFMIAGEWGIASERYEVLHVVADPARQRHAVVYRHHPADSSAVVDGIWIVEGSAPPLGSNLSPEGVAVAVWRGLRPTMHWKDGRLIIAGDVDPAAVVQASSSGANCDIAKGSAGTQQFQLCFDSSRVTFVRTKL